MRYVSPCPPLLWPFLSLYVSASLSVSVSVSLPLSPLKKVSFYFSILLFVSISPSCHVCVYAQVIFLYLPSCDRLNVAKSCRKCLSPKPSPSSSTSCLQFPSDCLGQCSQIIFLSLFYRFLFLGSEERPSVESVIKRRVRHADVANVKQFLDSE